MYCFDYDAFNREFSYLWATPLTGCMRMQEKMCMHMHAVMGQQSSYLGMFDDQVSILQPKAIGKQSSSRICVA